MNKVFIGCAIVVVILLCIASVVGVTLTNTYNTMVTASQAVDNQQAQVEVVLQRRFDLIPNLVNSVKGIMNQEQEVFTAIAEARTRYAGTQPNSDERVQAANEVESTLGRLLVIMENYPQLKSDQAVQGLMDELTGSENRISVERRRFNDTATTYNTLIKTFPNSVYANFFGFKERTLFKAAAGADVAPTVDLIN